MEKQRYFILQPKNQIYRSYLYGELLLREFTHLTQRLIIQAHRRPSSLISGIIQPLLWLILFGSLFQNTPIGLFAQGTTYGSFLSCGIIVFTSFTGSLNAGLPLIFDREFGFLNRLLVAPMISKDILLLSLSWFMICITILQTTIITIFSLIIFKYSLNFKQFYVFIIITFLITSSTSNLSLTLAFLMPGHIEFFACILLINLPVLFSSTALAPLSFMPYWLQIFANCNPLTYAIEAVRFISIAKQWQYSSKAIETLWMPLSLSQTLIALGVISTISYVVIKNIATNKLE